MQRNYLLKTALFFTFVWYCTDVQAQKESIGIMGGVNSSNVFSNIHGGTGYNSGLSFDVVYKYVPKTWLELTSGLQYDQRGFDYYVGGGTAHIGYQYLALPLVVVFRHENWFFGHIGFGVDPALRIDAVSQWPDGNGFVPVRDLRPSLFDFGAFIAPGIGFDINDKLNIRATIKARYSFTSVTNADYNSYLYIRNFGFYFQVGANYTVKIITKKKVRATKN